MMTYRGVFIILATFRFGIDSYEYSNNYSDIEIQYTWEESKNLCFTITNTGTETTYLFDSYLRKEYVNNKYFRRYDSEYMEYKLSFLPFINFLDLAKSDRYVVGEDKVVSEFQVTWSLVAIEPNRKYKLCLPVDLLSEPYSMYEDFDVLYFSDKETLSPIFPQEKFDFIKLELAFYSQDEAKFLQIEDDYNVTESDFLKAEMGFKVQSVNITFPKK